MSRCIARGLDWSSCLWNVNLNSGDVRGNSKRLPNVDTRYYETFGIGTDKLEVDMVGSGEAAEKEGRLSRFQDTDDALVGNSTGQRPESECDSRESLGLLQVRRDE